ncbi:putative Holin-X, holin superfamily III [Nocardia amikacinitolerans]|uniref:phage holin family protein n=1 Tax=Nocardia amikacinitolerans TaxID=756689 RepID=UPI00082B3B42|nr:phage holin family protein [Nocardia amikacinitolerans]MCP2320002.1 putative Holin-X, holin superfamily III [Nocardia amikacinitolerans]
MATTHERHTADHFARPLARLGAPARRRWRRLRADLLDKLKLVLLGGVLLGFAAVAVLSAGYLFLGFGVEALGQWMPRWLAMLVCALVLLLTSVVAGGLGMFALSRSRRTRR